MSNIFLPDFMKTYSNLWQRFVSVDNFELAVHESQLGKSKKRQVIAFNEHRKENTEALRQMVIEGKFHTSAYRSMVIYEPKKRTIYKLPYYPDRIVQHAVMNILKPILTDRFIYDSYACVEGKGQMRASRRCSQFVRRNKYCLKCDIHHFYPSIRHDILSGMFHKIIKDEKFMAVLYDIIYSFEGETNAPIGNYTSQWFGNFYLTKLDYYVKQELGIKDYERYCDDFMLFSNDKAYLHECRRKIEKFILDELGLTFSKAFVFDTKQGVDFCGYRTFGKYMLLRKSTAKRVKRRINHIYPKYTEEKRRASIASTLGWLKHCNSYNLKVKLGLV